MGKLGLGPSFAEALGVCVCVVPRKKERGRMDGWTGNFPRQRRTWDRFEFSKARAIITLGRTWSITYLIGITHSVAKREEEKSVH